MKECGIHGFFEDEVGATCPIGGCAQILAVDEQPVLYCDGAGWNGKRSRFCVVDQQGRAHISTLTTEFTNNEMEYRAVITALLIAPPGAMIRTDSKLVVGQLLQGWKINMEHLRKLHDGAMKLLHDARAILVWVPREHNKAGKHLELTA